MCFCWNRSQYACCSHRSKLSLEIDKWGEARGETRGFSQQPKGTWPSCLRITWRLLIIDFILKENLECCNDELFQTLTLLHSEWSKEIEPSRQHSTHHALIVSNPIDKKGSEFLHRNMRWEAPLMLTAAYDPHLLCEHETPLVNWKDFVSETKRFQQVVS